ncbi:MAG TPA: sigma-70 family RNA polymerase sigma factor [Chthonomonadaceae bacterium]|nr:sigma-70 family RNA polymerase sigma factor [Chthonomonadaceae bacterium]
MLTSNYNQSRGSMVSAESHPRRRADDEVLRLLQEYRVSRRPELRDRIVMQYTNLVESVARRFSGAAEPVEDLAQEGYIGLITAVDLYDPSKNVKFSTYATHFIIGQIKHYLRDRGKIIKEPAWLQELNQRVTKAMEALAQQLSRPATNLEIAQALGMTEESVAEMLMTREVFKVTSIDGGSDSDDDSPGTLDMERQRATDVAVSFQMPVEDRIVLESALLKLKDLEQKVLAAFYFRHLNQTEIARQMGISCNYVSHILRNATKKLKKILVTEELRDTGRRAATPRRRADDLPAPDPRPLVDRLTRLYSRGYFDSRLEEELSRASRECAELAVIFVKIGGMEAYQRANGTLKVDETVHGLVSVIRSAIRRHDILTRYDNDMFAVILPFTGRNAIFVANRMSESLAGWIAVQQDPRDAATLMPGVGVALYPFEAEHPVSLADLARERTAQPAATLRRAA